MNNLEVGKIYTFKLNTGEEVVARLLQDDPTGILIEHPILTVLSPQGLQLMPGLFSANLDKKIRLNNYSWAMVAEARDDVADSWLEATTGIKPVSKQILTS